MRNHTCLLFALALPLAAQSGGSLFGRFSFGVSGGVALNSSNQNAITAGFVVPANFVPYGDTSGRYTVGPNMEFAFTDHFSVQFNPLYRRFRSEFPVSIAGSTVPANFGYRTSTNAWEFPLIAKYYFGRPDASWRFFAGTGYSFAMGWQQTNGPQSFQTSQDPTVNIFPIDYSYRTPTQVGAVFSEGVSWQKGRWALAPELRYTRWGGSSGSRHRNQFDLLLNLRF